MQIFVQLPSGKTVTVNCCLETTVGHVVKIVNALHLEGRTPVTILVFKKAFYEVEHPMKVEIGQVLSPEKRLTELYVNGIIKEITVNAVH
jgi:hypothetical protein